MTKLSSVFALLALTLPLPLASCSEEEFPVLFEEEGVWALTHFDIEGTGEFETFSSGLRRDKFLLNFRRTSGAEQQPAGKLAAASCRDDNGDESVLTAQCNQGYACRCFDYTYGESQMVWREYAGEGETLYEPMKDDPPPGDPVVVGLREFETANTYVFTPLPVYLFDSLGVGSSYRFQQRAMSVFASTPCNQRCFGDE